MYFLLGMLSLEEQLAILEEDIEYDETEEVFIIYSESNTFYLKCIKIFTQ